MFQVTGASRRASGYGAPPTPPVPYGFEPLAPAPLSPEGSSCAPEQAARMAAIVGIATPATPARRRNSRRLSVLGSNAFGCWGTTCDTPLAGSISEYDTGQFRRFRLIACAHAPRSARRRRRGRSGTPGAPRKRSRPAGGGLGVASPVRPRGGAGAPRDGRR